MSKELLMNNIKNVIISNLATNETILMELNEYNDVTQGSTYMVFTQSRIFYWHENAASAKLKTKSYNLISLVMVSRGVFAIHFNDEIIKLLIAQESQEALGLIEILSPYVEVKYAQVETKNINKRNKKKKKSINPVQFTLPKVKFKGSGLVRWGIIVLMVVLISSLGTLGFSSAKEWWMNRNVDNGLTTEKVAEITAEIEAAEARVFMFDEYKQVVGNYILQLESIALDIEKIDPSDKAFDWASSENTMNNFKMTLYNLSPKEFVDTGITFNLDNQYATQQSKLFFDDTNKILDKVLSGIVTKFSNLPDLIALNQDVATLIGNIKNSISVVDTEIGNLNAYISEKRALINQ